MVFIQVAPQLSHRYDALITVIQLLLISCVLLIDRAEARVAGGWPAGLLPIELVQIVLHFRGRQLESVRILLPHPILKVVLLQIALNVLGRQCRLLHIDLRFSFHLVRLCHRTFFCHNDL